ncbi:MAG: Ig-like domain-containing protein [Candidatus Taylorbacteria bacterium]|nr:Ig-like domain-containing protein [Candidatus Taylorbacteria bacterium]
MKIYTRYSIHHTRYIFLIFLVFFGWTSDVFATSISKTNPDTKETVKVLGSPVSSFIGIYSPCDTEGPYTQQTNFNGGEGDILLDPNFYDFGCIAVIGWYFDTYYVFVFTDASKPCYNGEEENFSICRAEAAEEFTFVAAGAAGGANLTPDISITPFERNVFGNSIVIKYEADDLDDARGNAVYGLGENPVSLYYFEGDSPSGRILIAENLQAEGSYVWNTENVPSGNTYRVLAMVKDKILSVDSYGSNFFSIDHSVPVFDLKIDPTATKGEDVRIIIEASEELIKFPEVNIAQKSYKPVMIDLNGIREGSIYRTVDGNEVFKKFEGVYKVVSGYDGMAEILISGEDVAGNTGKTIKGNSRFAVGVEPPPKPVIISPLDQDITASDSIDIFGKAREDLEILISVNGEGEFKVRPDTEGNFSVKALPLSATYNNGLNFITVIGRDSFGNTSEAAVVNVKLNADPAVFVRFPQRDSNLNSIAAITIAATDENNDELRFLYEIKPVNGENWTVLAQGVKEKRIRFDTTKFSDGQYVLRITADDGFIKSQVISETFNIRNFRPVISFSDGEKTIIGQSSYILSGSVVIPEKVRDVSRLVSLEYSLDPIRDERSQAANAVPGAGPISNGGSWPAVPLDISSNGFEAKFSFSLIDLKEKAHNILFRAKDSRGLDGKATKILIVDFGPPPAPVVLSPQAGVVLSNADDQDANKAGVQFTISGTAEPESDVIVTCFDCLEVQLLNKSKTGVDGKFTAQATLRKHGLNRLKVQVVDAAGNRSPETELTVTYNNPPELKFINPRPNRGLDRRVPVKWEAVDPDGDEIKNIALSYARAGEPFKNLTRLNLGDSRGSTSGGIGTDLDNNFEWDVSGLAQGNYQMRLEATDGVSAGIKIIDFFIDNTAPRVELESLVKNVFTKEFILDMSGKAFDDLAGVEFVEFGVDPVRDERSQAANAVPGAGPISNGTSWFKTTITRGFLTKEARFQIFKKFKLDDGIYNVRFRAVDGAGNESEIKSQEIIIDTKPPRIGSYVVSSGAIGLFPEGGKFLILEGQEVDFKISLEEDTKTAILNLARSDLSRSDLGTSLRSDLQEGASRTDLGERTDLEDLGQIGLVKNNATGLWESTISLIKPGFKQARPVQVLPVKVRISAEDKNGNMINNKEIGEIEIVKKGKASSDGKPVPEAKITVQVFDEDNQSYTEWQGEAHGKENPVYTDAGGEYELLLPAGKYQLLIKKRWFTSLKVSEFNLEQPRYVNFDFELEPRKGIRGYLENIIEQITE